jgi:hypothetical protein
MTHGDFCVKILFKCENVHSTQPDRRHKFGASTKHRNTGYIVTQILYFGIIFKKVKTRKS